MGSRVKPGMTERLLQGQNDILKCSPCYNSCMQKAAFLDLDHTLYNGYLFQDWMEFLISQGGFSKKVLVSLDLKLLLNRLSGLDYFKASEDVAKAIGGIIKGHKTAEVFPVTLEFVKSANRNFYDYAIPAIKKLKTDGFRIILVTNEADFLAEYIKDYLEADDALGLDFEIKNGVFTGKGLNDYSGKNSKAGTIREYADKNNINLEKSLAMGDSEADLKMLEAVGKGYLINADEKTKEKAKALRATVINEESQILQI